MTILFSFSLILYVWNVGIHNNKFPKLLKYIICLS